MILYIPIPMFRYFRNDVDKRKFMAMGIAAGISAAFGAPIGGSLFAYELSKPNTFWTFSLTWRVFFSCSICTFFLNIFKAIEEGEGILIQKAGIIKLVADQYNPVLGDLPASVIIGTLSGLLGFGFIFFNTQINVLRKKHLKTKLAKIVEPLFIILLTASFFFFYPLINNKNCTDI